MIATPVYLDNHATTRVDPRVVQAMLPFLTEKYGNPGSVTHSFGWEAKEAVDNARQTIAAILGAEPAEIIFTSGATESNNLALYGAADRLAQRGRHIVSVATEHRAVLDPLERLSRRGFEVTLLPVQGADHVQAGMLDVQRLVDALRPDTILVSVMLANNEIGAIQPLQTIGPICQQRGILLHCDATQAVGKVPVDLSELPIDLMSFSGHKIYGPRGIGALYVRKRRPRIRLTSLIDGGGQEGGLRSGTLNSPGIVGLATAMELCRDELPAEMARLAGLRNRLFAGLVDRIEGVSLNGPALDGHWNPTLPWRLPGNLNVRFAGIDGEALIMNSRDLALSSGSACTSSNPQPSHVLRALGLDEDQIRSSLRFGLGRFTTTQEIDFAIDVLALTTRRLRQLTSRIA